MIVRYSRRRTHFMKAIITRHRGPQGNFERSCDKAYARAMIKCDPVCNVVGN